MDIYIREAKKKDLPQILTIYKDSGIDVKYSYAISEARKQFNKICKYPNYKIYVAESNRQIVATFALLIMDNLAHAGDPSGIVEDVAVLQAYQRQGIGKKMMQFAINICKNNKCYKMILSSNEKRIDAHKFYKSLGFVRHGFSF